MSLILAPDGLPATKTDVPLTAAATRMLIDGSYFIEHLSQLADAAVLEPYCAICESLGLDPTLHTALKDDRLDFTCNHTAGYVMRGRILDLEPLLTSLGWNIRCSTCQMPAQGDNNKTDSSFTVTCPCSRRSITNPLGAHQS